jgi:hypothetical protein
MIKNIKIYFLLINGAKSIQLYSRIHQIFLMKIFFKCFIYFPKVSWVK